MSDLPDTFPINGINLPTSTLLEPGTRVARAVIESGEMFEVEVEINNTMHYLPLWTPLGVAAIINALGDTND